MKILYVCTGNTCRSPMAEALMKQKHPEYDVQSAGTHAMVNMPANDHAVEALESIGISIAHMSQPVTGELLAWADIVLTMTIQHKQLLMAEYPDYFKKYFTVKEYALGSESTAMNLDISDPYGSRLDVYKATLKELEKYIEKTTGKLN